MEQINHSGSQQLKLMAEVLSKMGTFFNQMAEQCLSQLSDSSYHKQNQKMLMNRQILKNLGSDIKMDLYYKNKENESQNDRKGDRSIVQIKNHKPKHPVSSFFFFYKEKGQEIAKERGQILGSRIAKIVGQLWKNMSQEERQPYQLKARITRRKYEQEMTEYRMKYADEIVHLQKYKKQMKQMKKLREDAKISQVDVESKEIQIKSNNEKVQSQLNFDADPSDQSDDLSDELSDSLLQKSLQLPLNTQLSSFGDSSDSQDRSDPEEIKQSNQQQLSQICKLENVEGDGTTQPIKKISKQKEKFENIEMIIKQTQKQNIADKSKRIPINLNEVIPKPEINNKPIKPKGPVSSFFIFYKAKGKQLAEKYGLSLGPKVIKIASGYWKDLSSQEKLGYEVQARQTRQKYHKQVEQMKRIYGDDILQKIKPPKSTKNKKKKQEK